MRLKTKDELEAVLALRSDRNFQLFLTALGAELERLNQCMVNQTGSDSELRCLQGQVRFGVQLLDAITSAEAEYAKHTGKKT